MTRVALVEQCVQENRVAIERPIAPQRWNDYQCDEYFAGRWWDREHYDPEKHLWAGVPESHLWVGVYDHKRIHEDVELGFLAVASSGCDGIDFGYRKQCEGLWAYYPIEDRFKLMAPTIAALRLAWCEGNLSV